MKLLGDFDGSSGLALRYFITNYEAVCWFIIGDKVVNLQVEDLADSHAGIEHQQRDESVAQRCPTTWVGVLVFAELSEESGALLRRQGPWGFLF